MNGDVGYFTRRAAEERTAGLQSRDPAARRAHIERAERYEDLVRGISRHTDRLGLPQQL